MNTQVNKRILSGGKSLFGQIIIAAIFILPLTIIMNAVSGSAVKIIALISVPFLIYLFFNFHLSLILLVILTFVNIRMSGMAISAIFTIFILFTFFLNFDNIRLQDFQSPIISYFSFFILACIPSIIGTDALPEVLFQMINLVVFAILFILSIAIINYRSDIKKFFTIYIIMTLINSSYLIYLAIKTKSRVFGFTGIMFVDYVGIAIIVTFIWILLSGRKMRLLYIPLFAVFMFTSILTQTRNAWISIVLLILIIISFFYFNSKKFNVKKQILIISLLTVIISLGTIFVFLNKTNFNVSERIEQFNESDNELLNQQGEVTSSLVSRLFIWDTALNAFRNNPLIGVGLYAFPYVSQKYYTIPKILFDLYVYRRTPHIAYLAIATEAGVIGLFGFLVFIFSMIKYSYESVRLSKTSKENIISLSLFFSLIYIVISMFMTDAWLWDKGIVLWGILLGLSMANRKILLKKYIT